MYAVKHGQHRHFPRVHFNPFKPAERFDFLIEPGTHAERRGDLNVPVPDVLEAIGDLYCFSPPLLEYGLGKLS